ncbi:MAG: YwaF family protein [Oscillospiraceae bacterium]|nr:YwaF family protein [Oscillospiraceae bacterium]
MATFWLYESELPAGQAWQLFSMQHIAVLSAVLAWTCFGRYLMWRLQVPGQRRLLRMLGVVILASEVLRMLFLAVRGYFTVYELPLHLCGVAVFLTCLDAFTQIDWVGQTLCTLCMPCAALALLFCDWTRYPIGCFYSVNSFISHGILLSYPLMAVSAGKIRPNPRSMWKVFLFLAVILPPIYWFDQAVSANYLFLNTPSAGSPLVFVSALLGADGYLVGYLALYLVGVPLMYALWALGARLHRAR